METLHYLYKTWAFSPKNWAFNPKIDPRGPVPNRIGSCAKLAPWYYGHLEILERIGRVAYILALPPMMKFHHVFHVSLLKIYVKDVDNVIH